MWIRICLLFDDSVAEVQYAGDAARKMPESGFGVPGAACGLDHGMKVALVRFGLDADNLECAWSDRRGLDEEFDSGVTELAVGVGSVAHANECVSVVASQADGASICRGESLQHAVMDTLGFHGGECREAISHDRSGRRSSRLSVHSMRGAASIEAAARLAN